MRQPGPSVDPLLLSFQLALAGRYSIDREIGRGGMGVVYLAREVHLDRPVAIKLLPPERAGDPALRDRFLREARIAAKLSHPNIIPIHAVDETDEFVYFVMAYVDGETLAHRVRTRGPLSGSEASRVLREVAWALAYAHGQGVVHRDVKPDNILLESASGRVLVADFGIAAAAGDVGADHVSGTPEFMSPEQALGGEIDARSDLYGLGATAFYALSGRLPFEGTSPTQVLAKQVTEPAPPVASLGMPVPRKLALLVDRCLAKKPEHRPASAQTVAEQLGVALEQRREVPPMLRTFVKRTGRLDGGGTLIGGAGLLTASIGAAIAYGRVAGFTAFLVGGTVASMTYLTAVARRLTLQGFSRDDLEPAFRAEIEQAREELAVYHPRSGATIVERGLGVVAKLSGAAFAAFFTAAMVFGPRREILLGFALSSAAFCLTTAGHLSLAQLRKDVSTEAWAKVWLGRIGMAAFAIGRRLVGRGAIVPAMTHRATELSLGMAAEQLYESLPKEMQRELAELPELLRRLQADAQILRRLHDDVQEAIADAGDAGSSAKYAGVRASRDVLRAKLSESVSALETIRLNLLRLHAGSATLEGLTTHLGLAADVAEDVGRLIAGHLEVDAMLDYPREIAATPV